MSSLLPRWPVVRWPRAGWLWSPGLLPETLLLLPSVCWLRPIGSRPLKLLQTSGTDSSCLFPQLLLQSEDTAFRNFQETCPPVSLSEWTHTHCQSSTCRQMGQPQPIKPQPEVGGMCGVTNLNQICSAWEEKGNQRKITRTWTFLRFCFLPY